jgi:hypothetical protein
MFKFRAVLADPAVFIPQRRETGRPLPIQILRLMYKYSPE